MLRIGLTSYLVFMTMAGPGLCCCLPERLAHFLAFDGPEAEPNAMGTHCKSCCHQEKPTDQQGTSSRNHSKPECPTCPCQQSGAGNAMPSQGADQLKQVLLRNNLLGPAGFVPVAFAVCPQPLEPDIRNAGEGVFLPFLTAHDFLMTFHMLRC